MTLKGMDAPDKLKAFCREKKLPYPIIGELVGVSGQTVAQWAASMNRPSFLSMHVLEVLCKITPEDWLTDEEKLALVTATKNIIRLKRAKPKPPKPLTLREKVAGKL